MTDHTQTHRPFPVVVAGHVDHGKSTLVGRLLHDTGALADGRLDQVRTVSERRGLKFEWSFLIDALQAERDQGITIDTAQVHFRSETRRYLLIDAPGHKEFLKNMVTGAAQAAAAVLIVDVTQGLAEQSRRHAYLLSLIGVRRVVVAVNKMDAVGYAESAFQPVREAARDYLRELGLEPAAIVPISARTGDNLVLSSVAMGWYQGPTVLGALDRLPAPAAPVDRPLRLSVQDVYRQGTRRLLVGTIDQGRLRVADPITLWPSGRKARVATIERWPEGAVLSAAAGRSVGITLTEELFVERGEVIAHQSATPQAARRLRLRLFWFLDRPLAVGDRYRLKLGTAETEAVIEAIERVIDVESLAGRADRHLGAGDIGEVVVQLKAPLAFDSGVEPSGLARGVLLDGPSVAGGAVVLDPPEAETARARNLVPVRSQIGPERRRALFGHQGGILWLTGLSGAGKSTLARAAEAALIEAGWRAQLLDADTLRATVNADLGFSVADRSENVRRIGEIARLLADSGQVVLVACIAPLKADRARLRQAAGGHFHEIYVNAPLATCEARDVKGFYSKARQGSLPQFTGVGAGYEPPESPHLEIRTDQLSEAEAVARLIAYARQSCCVGDDCEQIARRRGA